MAAKPLPSPDLLRQLLRYEPETGALYWLPRPVSMFADERSWRSWHTRCIGIPAFTAKRDNGYLVGNVFGRNLRAHRVIWAVVHGEWPPYDIDHINGDRADNRICNLRAVDRGENRRNSAQRCDNTSGTVGVYWLPDRLKWRAQIVKNGVSRHLGEFSSKAEAIRVRKAAERRLGFHPNHGRSRFRP